MTTKEKFQEKAASAEDQISPAVPPFQPVTYICEQFPFLTVQIREGLELKFKKSVLVIGDADTLNELEAHLIRNPMQRAQIRRMDEQAAEESLKRFLAAEQKNTVAKGALTAGNMMDARQGTNENQHMIAAEAQRVLSSLGVKATDQKPFFLPGTEPKTL